MRAPLDPNALPGDAPDAAIALDVLDARLMRILLVLLTERTVSRAAVRLNMSQPATSAALSACARCSVIRCWCAAATEWCRPSSARG